MNRSGPRPLVAGNWKMNGLAASHSVLAAVAASYDERLRTAVDLVVCPPATLIHAFAEAARATGVAVGGQDAHAEAAGAYTGNVSPEMLADLGATFVILGHSERRTYQREVDADVRAKAMGARRAGLTAIVCVGETRAEREAGRALDVVAEQLSGSVPADATAADLVIAYEPVWAIGTGLTPTTDDVAAMHSAIRARLRDAIDAEAAAVRLLYGGSVKPANARELLAVPDVDGALVGGASLVAGDFLGIARAYL